MKRDWDLIRKILLKVEEKDDTASAFSTSATATTTRLAR